MCVSVMGPTLEDINGQLQEALAVADIIEFRLDLFGDPEDIRKVRKECSKPIILTLRPRDQGGAFTGSEEERLAMVHSFLDLEPDYVDLEYTVPEQVLPPKVKLIRSYHNFENTPEDLDSILAMLCEIPASLYKIATTAGSTLDALRLLVFAKKTDRPITVMAMGKKGECTRILGPVVGCPITYASLDEQNQTAPGQIPARELLNLYHYHQMNPSTKLYGLIGDPVEQSIGHKAHNAYMNDLQAVYVKLHILPEELEPFFRLAVDLGFRGLSVTIPHKETVIPILDEIDPLAKRIGAVNTLKIEEGSISGFNTDARGALEALEAMTPVSGKHLVLLGAGGACRAIAYEAKRRGASVLILNRTPSRAAALAEELSCDWGGLEDIEKSPYDIIINSTANGNPIPSHAFIPSTTAMDIAIQPTEFLRAAQSAGCQTVYGNEMYVRQALEQTKIWFE